MGCRGRLFFFLVVCGLALAGSAEEFFHTKKAAAAVADDYFKKLGVEKPEKAIRAPGFTLEDLSGRRLGPKELRGKVVFLNFWATWCVPCREEMPTMERLQRGFKEHGLEVVAVNIKESKKEVRSFLGKLGVTFTVLLDRDGKVSDDYGAWAIPLSYFINRRGEFIGKVEGDRKWDSPEAKDFFRQFLGEKN